MGENGDNFNNYQYNNYDYNRTHNELDRHVSLAGTAMILGFASIPLVFFLNLGIIVGGIAIVLAILSKGICDRFLPQAKRAIIFGSIGVVLGYGMVAFSLHSVLTDPTYMDAMNQITEQMYGESFEDLLRDMNITIGDD